MGWLRGQQPSQKWTSAICASYFGAGGDGAPPWQGLEGGGGQRQAPWLPLHPLLTLLFGYCVLACEVSFVLAIKSVLFHSLFTLGITQFEHF